MVGRDSVEPWSLSGACVSRASAMGTLRCSWVEASPEWPVWVVGNHQVWSGLDGVSPYQLVTDIWRL